MTEEYCTHCDVCLFCRYRVPEEEPEFPEHCASCTCLSCDYVYRGQGTPWHACPLEGHLTEREQCSICWDFMLSRFKEMQKYHPVTAQQILTYANGVFV